MTDAANEQLGVGQAEDRPTSPDEIRDQIEHTREQLGDTVAALAEKTDVKAQAKARISAVKETAHDKKEQLAAKARQATPDSASAGAQQVSSAVSQRPLPFAAAGALAAGLLLGWRIGRRRRR